MIEKKILKKGQIVIPKAIRELKALNEGDTIKIKKEKGISERLKEIAEKHEKELSVEEMKDLLKKRYEE